MQHTQPHSSHFVYTYTRVTYAHDCQPSPLENKPSTKRCSVSVGIHSLTQVDVAERTAPNLPPQAIFPPHADVHHQQYLCKQHFTFSHPPPVGFSIRWYGVPIDSAERAVTWIPTSSFDESHRMAAVSQFALDSICCLGAYCHQHWPQCSHTELTTE